MNKWRKGTKDRASRRSCSNRLGATFVSIRILLRYEAEASSLRREMASLTDENKQLMNSSEEATAVQAIRDKLQDEVEQKQKVLQRLQESEKHISVLQVDHKQMQQQLTKQQADHTAQAERVRNDCDV